MVRVGRRCPQRAAPWNERSGPRQTFDLPHTAHYKVARTGFNIYFIMPRTLRVGMIGYRFMGKAHSNAWRQAPRFFNLPADVELHTIVGRDPEALEQARVQLGWKNSSTDW